MVKDMATCDVNLVQNALGIQQTGPRTVIVPADPIIWSADTSYEYLTLVATTDFGQAYISKRDVPAGTPLTNTEYWIPAASYNAQLAAIQAALNDKANSSDLTDLTLRFDDLKFGANVSMVPYGSFEDTTISLIAQSIAYSGANYIYISAADEANATQKIYRLDINADSIAQYNFNLSNYHFNSIDVYANEIYACSGVTNKVAVISTSSMTLTREITTGKVYNSIKRNGSDGWVAKTPISDGIITVDLLNNSFAVTESHNITLLDASTENYQNIVPYGDSYALVTGRGVMIIDGVDYTPKASYTDERLYYPLEFEDIANINGLYVTLCNGYNGFILSVMYNLNPSYAARYVSGDSFTYTQDGTHWKANFDTAKPVIHHHGEVQYYIDMISSVTLTTDCVGFTVHSKQLVINGGGHKLTNCHFRNCVLHTQDVTFDHDSNASEDNLFMGCFVSSIGGVRFTCSERQTILNTILNFNQGSNPDMTNVLNVNSTFFVAPTNSINYPITKITTPIAAGADIPMQVSGDTAWVNGMLRSKEAYAILATSTSATNTFSAVKIISGATHTSSYYGVGVCDKKPAIIAFGIDPTGTKFTLNICESVDGSTQFYLYGIYYA